VPTSKRPQINNAQYLRIPNKVLKCASHEGVVNDEVWQSDVNLERMECRDTQISCIATKIRVEPLEACRPKEGLKSKRPSTQKYLAGPSGAHPQGGLHYPWCPEHAGRAMRVHRPQKITHPGRPMRLAEP
jgi:hypothetical protein